MWSYYIAYIVGTPRILRRQTHDSKHIAFCWIRLLNISIRFDGHTLICVLLRWDVYYYVETRIIMSHIYMNVLDLNNLRDIMTVTNNHIILV